MGETPGFSPLYPMPFVGTPWRVGSRVIEFYSSIMASLPSDTGSTSRKRSCIELDYENHDNDRVDRHYDRWFVFQYVDSDHPMSKLSPFLLSKAIKSAVWTVKTLRRLRNGDFLLEVSSALQSRIVNKLDNLAGCPVTACPHRTLNTCKGVIWCAPLVDCDKEEIISELKPQGVSDIMNISVRDDSGGRRNTNTFIVTFKAPTTPRHLHVGYLRVPVSIYIPNPLRCFKCQKFGHGKNACRGRETCATCSEVGHSNNNVQMRQSARTVLAVTLPSAKAALNGSLRKGFSK